MIRLCFPQAWGPGSPLLQEDSDSGSNPLFNFQVLQQRGPTPDLVSISEPVLCAGRCHSLAAAVLVARPHQPPVPLLPWDRRCTHSLPPPPPAQRPPSSLPLALGHLWVSVLSSRLPPLGDGLPRLVTAGHWPFGPGSHVEFGSGDRERRCLLSLRVTTGSPLNLCLDRFFTRDLFPRSRLERITLGLLLCSATVGVRGGPQRAVGSAINQPLFCPLLCRTPVHELSVSASAPVPPLGGAGP